MPKRVKKTGKLKQKPAAAWPPPKRGKARANSQNGKSRAQCKNTPQVPYVRFENEQKKFQKQRNLWGVSVQDIATMKGSRIIQFLRGQGILNKWEKKVCPHCASGTLGPLVFQKQRNVWAHRCKRKQCQMYVQPHDFHPIFPGNTGQSSTPLGTQAAILCCAVAGVPNSAASLILNVQDKVVDRIYQNNDVARARHVKMKEPKIAFGGVNAWADVEADEVDLGKEEVEKPVDPQKAIQWEQWGGIVERGRPSTMILNRLKPALTKKRAPGPGAIRRRDWEPIARKHLSGRRVILHTDGARAYKVRLPDVIHDNVVHKKKRVVVNGKKVWIKPHYTKVFKHKLPSGKTISVKGGTQIIDRFWGQVRTSLRYISRKPSSKLLERKLRSAQWAYWHQRQNLWKATAAMLQDLF